MDSRNKQKLKTIVMIAIIIGSVLTLGLKFYMDNEAISVDRPSLIKTTPDKQAAILFGNSIFFINAFNQTTVFNFDDNQLKLQGDFDFFSNGDLLIYSNKEEPSLLQKIKTYARKQETRDERATGDNGFYRCQIQFKTCRKFTTNLPAFHSTFRVVIDRQTDTIYFADTTKFVIFKVNSNGNLLAQNSDQLHFPNQLFFQNNTLYIANTNKHAIKTVETNTADFGKEIASHESVIDSNHRWPSELIKTPDSWWIGVADGSMSNTRIQTFDKQWNKQQTITPTTPNADGFSIAAFGNYILMSDWSNIKIYRFTLSGEQIGDLNNTEINLAFEQSKLQIKEYEKISNYALIAFGIVFVFGLIAALVLEKKETLSLFKQVDDTAAEPIDTQDMPMPPGKEVYWIETKQRKYRKPMLILGSLPILYLLWASLTLIIDSKLNPFLLSFYFSTIPFAILIIWSWYLTLSVKIGISGYLLLIDDGRGNIGVGKNSAIKYSQNTILIGKAAVIVGHPRSNLFPKNEFDQRVIPRKLLGTKISQWAMFKALWEIKHSSVITAIGLVLYLIVALSLQA